MPYISNMEFSVCDTETTYYDKLLLSKVLK